MILDSGLTFQPDCLTDLFPGRGIPVTVHVVHDELKDFEPGISRLPNHGQEDYERSN